jgi:hypothetical protein
MLIDKPKQATNINPKVVWMHQLRDIGHGRATMRKSGR